MKKYLLILAAIPALLSSCLKDKEHEFISLFDNNQKVITEITDAYASDSKVISFTPDPVSEDFALFNIRSFNPESVQVNGELRVKVLVDNTLIPSGTEALPEDAYTVEEVVTIPESGNVDYMININKTNLDPAITYALGFKIDQSNGGVVSALANHLIVSFVIKNKYDGNYTLYGRAEHPTNATLAGEVGPESDFPLVTLGAYSLAYQAHPWANGSGSELPAGYPPIITVDPSTNKVTISGGVGAEAVPGTDNHYDPDTKTFYVAWRYSGSGGFRAFYDTLTYIGPR